MYNKHEKIFSVVLIVLLIILTCFCIYKEQKYTKIEKHLESYIIMDIDRLYDSVDDLKKTASTSHSRELCAEILLGLREFNMFESKIDTSNIEYLIMGYQRIMSDIDTRGIDGSSQKLELFELYMGKFQECDGDSLIGKIINFNNEIFNDEEFGKLIRMQGD